jgi:hypothetical protein
MTKDKTPKGGVDLSALKQEVVKALDQCVDQLGDGAQLLCEKLHDFLDRLANKPAMMKAPKPLKCGPGGETDHSACCHSALEASMETTALLLHACCCCDGDYE